MHWCSACFEYGWDDYDPDSETLLSFLHNIESRSNFDHADNGDDHYHASDEDDDDGGHCNQWLYPRLSSDCYHVFKRA